MNFILAATTIVILALAGCASNPLPGSPPPNSTGLSPDFSFTYSFGVFSAYSYNSETGIFSRDNACNRSAQREFYLPLTAQEKEAIQAAIVENGLQYIKSDLSTCPLFAMCPGVMPPSGATLAFSLNGSNKTITWSNSYPEDDSDYKRFSAVHTKLYSIIMQKAEAAGIPIICYYQ